MKSLRGKYSAVVIEDEPSEADYISHIIKEYNPELVVDHVFKNAVEASRYLARNYPDFVFMDVEMPKMSGIDIAGLLVERPDCSIVFLTGHKDYALDAMRLGVYHYLLKPIRPSDIRNLVTRILDDKIKKNPGSPIFNNKLRVNSNDKLLLLDLQEILYLEADGSYTKIHLTEQKIVRVSKRLGIIKQDLMDLDYFLEVSRSLVVNLTHIKEIERGEKSGDVILSNGQILKLSTRTTQQLAQLMQTFIWRG